jgi:hypothetical protein
MLFQEDRDGFLLGDAGLVAVALGVVGQRPLELVGQAEVYRRRSSTSFGEE